MLRPLNPLLHSELRLAVMSLLVSVGEADFVYLRKQTGATAGNLSVQIDKLSKAGYIEVTKSFVGKRTNTSCRLTEEGMQAFEEYVEAIKEYLKAPSRPPRGEEIVSKTTEPTCLLPSGWPGGGCFFTVLQSLPPQPKRLSGGSLRQRRNVRGTAP